MNINFNMDIDLNAWAEAIGYRIFGDMVIPKKAFTRKDFEQSVAKYISESLEAGTNSGAIQDIFFNNDDEQTILKEILEECNELELSGVVIEDDTEISEE